MSALAPGPVCNRCYSEKKAIFLEFLVVVIVLFFTAKTLEVDVVKWMLNVFTFLLF